MESIKITLDEIMEKVCLKAKGEFDLVVAIGRGGILPAYLVSRFLDVKLDIIYLEFRDKAHKQKYDQPKLTKKIDFDFCGKNILLVDDISNSGTTLKQAQFFLKGSVNIKTLVIYGDADISLFGKHTRCVQWPWEE